MADRYTQVKALIAAQPMPPGVEPAAVVLQQLCAAASGHLPITETAATILSDTGVPAVIAASGRLAQNLEDIQNTAGEGPGVDAYHKRRPILVPALAKAWPRWPAYAPAAIDAGAAAVFAFPLQIGAARLGTLTFCTTLPGELTADSIAWALTFADTATTMLLDLQAGSSASLNHAIDAGAALFQAQGMVMAQLQISLADALARIRAHAFGHDRSLADVAADIVARRIEFSKDEKE
jgi:GAF domain/ANTAR domain